MNKYQQEAADAEHKWGYEAIHRFTDDWHWLIEKQYVTRPIHFITIGSEMLCYETMMPRFGAHKMENVTCLECRRRLVKLLTGKPNAK